VVLLVLTVAAIASGALAREKQTVRTGVNACLDFCERKNSTDASRNKCAMKCNAYWFCNGSDSSDPYYVEQCKHFKEVLQQ
jgi:hypothetical protein